MSQENVEIFRRAMAAYEADDWDTLREITHPEVTLRPAEEFVESGPFVGREAVIRWRQETSKIWPDAVPEPMGEFIDIGDRVAVRVRFRGANHGPEMSLEYSEVWTFLDGMVIGVEMFFDHGEALRAVGVEE
jgi:ketosteroid isomerase-like protein